MQELMNWIDREVGRLEREMEGKATEGDAKLSTPELFKAALGKCTILASEAKGRAFESHTAHHSK
jgi:hypothetical protein